MAGVRFLKLKSEQQSHGTSNGKILILAIIGGAAIGTCVASINIVVGFVQTLLFGVDINSHSPLPIATNRLLIIIPIGGLLLGCLLKIASIFNHLTIVDPIEANLLKNGKMSLTDSLILVVLSSVSIAIGGSVGFEGAMTQLGAGLLSFIGQKLRLANNHLKTLVACGTGAAIAAIYAAPLAGAFYAVELVISKVSTKTLIPILLASAISSHVIYIIFGFHPPFLIINIESPSVWHFFLAATIGVLSAIIGITVMYGTTTFEKILKLFHIPTIGKPFIGAICLASIACIIPQVMGTSYPGIHDLLIEQNIPQFISLILLAKMSAAIICVGSQFKGGLFSTSLFLGAILGALIYEWLIIPLFGPASSLQFAVIVGMAGVATSIIGTPIAIILLTIETSGLHTGVVTIIIAVVVSSELTRYWFGYSFSTWRFHVREMQQMKISQRY